MQTLTSTRLIFITLLIGICLVVSGCSSTANKPPQPAPNPPIPSSPTPMPTSPGPNTLRDPNATSPAQTSVMEVANRAAMEAGKVVEVNEAAAIVQDKVIYIGLDLKANLTKLKITATEKNVMDRVKEIEPGYIVRVTSDTNTVAAIKTIAQGIAQGKSMTGFKKEMNMVMMKMVPKGV